jgi:hypothetical protein
MNAMPPHALPNMRDPPLIHDVATLTYVQTVQELPDILVPDAADLLDIGGRLRDVLKRVAGELKLVLDVL